MFLTDGQSLAIEQLREIEAASNGALEVLRFSDPDPGKELATALIAVGCRDMPRTPNGVPLRDRERFLVLVPSGFPFRPPTTWVTHTRFAGHPHVQWRRHLCLYQSTATEWDPSDGMFGFVSRLELWLRMGAIGQLDPIGAPLHPPAVYAQNDRLVIPRANAPAPKTGPWIGFAHLRLVAEKRVDIVGWSDILAKNIPAPVGAAILLSQEMPWEFPTKGKELLDQVEGRGVDRKLLLLALAVAAEKSPKGDPLFVIIGTPMRGVRGSGERLQHLTAWLIKAEMAHGLRLILNKFSSHEALQAIGQDVERLMLEWFDEIEVSWCSVREDRPEIVTRRDENTPASWFRGKTVSLWGCGALGAAIAEFLVRAGVQRLVLRDDGVVAPGLLARQPYGEGDIGLPKAEVLATRLRTIRPDGLELRTSTADLLDEPLALGDWTDAADVLVDASASRAVIDKLELRRRGARPVPILSVVIGHNADRGLVVLSLARNSGGVVDVLRKTKLAACSMIRLKGLADEFWPVEARHSVFQPEPGCSESTFVGSAADTFSLAGTLLNLAASDLREDQGKVAFAHLVVQPHVRLPEDEPRVASFAWDRDRVFDDPHSGYEIRVSSGAWRDIVAWIARSSRTAEFQDETGGLLFGERDDATRVIWVTDVLGPPPDSHAGADHFICGVAGVADANDEKRTRSRGSAQYVGMWHTHPGSLPVPSPTDIAGMAKLLTLARPSSPRPLLMIIGTTRAGRIAQVGAYVFKHRDFPLNRRKLIRWPVSVRATVQTPRPTHRDVGLALSGGGSRAIAFHLGCLRALNDRGVLERLQLVSGVSGGSVIAAMYAYRRESFAAFESRVVRMLVDGLVRRIVLELLSPSFLATLPWTLISGAVATGASGLRVLAKAVEMVFRPPEMPGRPWSRRIHAPLLRRFSRTVAFERALAKSVLGNDRLGDARRDGLEVVLNACELRTGTAFRFGSRESGSWRFGRLVRNDIKVAHAVASSAAFPALLPAFDEALRFVTRNGSEETHRVILTDGGVYDNLGITCMEPGRSEAFGYNTFNPSYIVSCDAGHGQFSGETYPYWWPSRMEQSFETVFRKNHDAALARLHEHASAGRLQGFVLPYLGQVDGALPYQAPDLVRREEVAGYPTDFSPMARATVERIALRGEQLTRLLISRYCPEL